MGPASSFSSIITTRAFDVTTGQYIGSSTHISDWAYNEPDPTRSAIKLVSFHSADPISIASNTLTVKLTNPDFYPWYGNGSYKFERSSYMAIEHNGVDINTGERLLININLIQSAVNIDGVFWMRGPLSVRNGVSYGMQPLRIHEPYGNLTFRFINPYRDYWRWNASMPMDEANNGLYDEMTDPCLAVYPAGTWRMPTAVEAQTVVYKEIDDFFIHYQEDIGMPSHDFGANIIHNHTSGPSTPEFEDSSLREFTIFFKGYRPASFPTDDVIPFPNSVREYYSEVYHDGRASYPEPISAMFWTSDLGCTPGTAEAYVRKINFTTVPGVSTTHSIETASIEDVDKNEGLLIRCVRVNSQVE